MKARESAWIPVPCAMPLTHGGAPPSKAKKYSQAVNVPRLEPSAIIASSSSRSFVHVRLPLLLQVDQAAFALPKLASGWICRPTPA